MSMEKQGVVTDENQAPTTKEATDGCSKPKCCKAEQACGTDTMSKMADALASDTVVPYTIKDK